MIHRIADIRRTAACFGICLVLFACASMYVSAQIPDKRILILNSYHQGYRWTDEIVGAVRMQIRAVYPTTEFYIENLDAKRFDSQSFREHMLETFRTKYADMHLDGIVSSDEEALQFLLDHRDEVFGNTPVVFCGVGNYTSGMLAGHTGITGLIQLQDNMRPTIDIALQLHPGTRRIAVIVDGTPESEGQIRQVRELMPAYPGIEFVFLSGADITFDELLAKLEDLPPDTVGLLLVWQRDHTGRFVTIEEGTRLISGHAAVPVYGLGSHRLGYGIVGGMLNNGTIQGLAAAGIMLQVLGGTPASDIAVHVQSVDYYSFDFAQLERWGIGDTRLPDNSYVIGKPFSFYETYRPYVLGVIGGFIVLISLVIALSIAIGMRRRAEKTAWKRWELLTNIISHIPHLVYWKGTDLVYQGCNDFFARSAGLASPGDIVGLTDADISWKRDQADRLETLERGVMDGSLVYTDVVEKDLMPGGKETQLLTSMVPVTGDHGTVIGVLGMYYDISERRQLEAQIVQAQKMESVGRLAGGIAHDFNNLLTVIIGNAEIALMDMNESEPYHAEIDEIRKTAERAAALTRQLLGFSRRQIIKPRILDLNEMLMTMNKMLRRLIGEDVELVIVPGERLGKVHIDPGQFEQIMTNLLVNSRDALPDGGKITIETANVTLDESYIQTHAVANPGAYVMISVSDNGHGMDKDTAAHIFEPFFTTKDQDRGTGLGLSICYGIVKQNGGMIEVYSEPGAGTTITIYLPEVEGMVREEEGRARADVPGGTETILVVEDEPTLNEMVNRILTSKGYRVIGVLNGDEALALIETLNDQTIHLVITDVIMPRIGGRELADRIQRLRPGIRVLFMSGYTDRAIVNHGILEDGIEFLQKPFRSVDLLRKVRHVLDSDL